MMQYSIEFGQPTPIKERWHKRLGRVITDKGWTNIFTNCHKSGLEAKFIWLQVRLVQNILGTNKRMHTIWPSEYPSALCTFCEREEESILHLFTECECIEHLWIEMEKWLQEKGYEDLKITRLMRLFGATTWKAREPINICIMITRFFIWYCRCSKTMPNFQASLKYLRFYLRTIKVSYYLEGQMNKYTDIWKNFTEWTEDNETN